MALADRCGFCADATVEEKSRYWRPAFGRGKPVRVDAFAKQECVLQLGRLQLPQISWQGVVKMKAEIKRKDLRTLLNFSANDDSLVKLAGKGDKLFVTFVHPFGEDLLFIEKSVPAYVTEEGAGLFQANALGKLKEWADKGRNDMLCVDCVAKYFELTAKIVGEDKLCRIPCDGAPDNTWPAYDRDKEIGEIRLDKLKAIVDRAKKGENVSGANYDEILSVELSSKGTTLAWTDGCVLYAELDELAPALTSGRVLLPAAAVKQLLKYADGASEVAAVSKVGIRTDGVSVTFGDLTERHYPDLTAVCEPRGSITIRADASALRTALKQVSSCLNWPVILRTKGDRLNVLAFDDRGKERAWDDCPRAEAWIEAETVGAVSATGYSMAFCVDARYLATVLAKADGTVVMQCQDEASPIYISVQNSGIKTVLMPVETDFLYKSV